MPRANSQTTMSVHTPPGPNLEYGHNRVLTWLQDWMSVSTVDDENLGPSPMNHYATISSLGHRSVRSAPRDYVDPDYVTLPYSRPSSRGAQSLGPGELEQHRYHPPPEAFEQQDPLFPTTPEPAPLQEQAPPPPENGRSNGDPLPLLQPQLLEQQQQQGALPEPPRDYTETSRSSWSSSSSMWDLNGGGDERRYSVPPSTLSEPATARTYKTTEDLHAWSIYRQNLNSDFTDSALGTSEKSQPPFGNFQLRESTVHTILNHPKYGPKERSSELGVNVNTYLRFGLPRVLPPHPSSCLGISERPAGVVTAAPLQGRENSSGYDSSDDDRNQLQGRLANPKRARSDPDFRSSHDLVSTEPSGVASAISAYERHRKQNHRLKANSEADLIAGEEERRWDVIPRPSTASTTTAAAAAPGSTHKGPPSRADSRMAGDRRSVAGSHVSLGSRATSQKQGLIRSSLFPRDSLYSSLPGGETDVSLVKHPHLQVRDLTFELDRSSLGQRLCGGPRTKLLLLEGLSFEVRGGEILAIIATSEQEGSALLDILANRHPKWGSRLRGDIMFNGLFMPPARLEHCVAYVARNWHLWPDMSVRQWMLFTSLLQEPGGPGRDTKARINALLEDLGLGQLKHTRIRDLTESEARRLNVGSQLLLDTDVVLLDQPISGMDILDSFFLIDYVRQWAARGRIVVMTIHPPTYEIFTMMTRVAIISTGRMVYHGKRRDLLPYFSYIDFPCPAFKNPSDYYLDLVTLDNLSPEAMLESSQRVENLVEVFRRRQVALSDPGPPGNAPMDVYRAGFFGQMLALWIRALIYTFPYNVVHFFRRLFLAAFISVLLGAIFWNVRAGLDQEHVLDRLGFHYALLALCLWPLLLGDITDVWREKAYVSRDINERLYNGIAYIISKLMYSLPTAAAIAAAYVFPAYSMTGLPQREETRNFGPYMGYTLLYLLTARAVAMTSAWTFPTRQRAAAFLGLVVLVFCLSGGYAVHLMDLSLVTSWLQWVSPLRWTLEQLAMVEFAGGATPMYDCPRGPVVLQENGIQVKAICGIVTDNHALALFGLHREWPTAQPILIVLAVHAVFVIASIIYIALKMRGPGASPDADKTR
ncbi:ATP-binding cassette sub-family G member 8 [Dermacentor variabilis]|uniref:ATP-binding cassette sub-family G member 8 n=1 Tax=Dermacentor variabilis TaxID=34621 RepID=UPI003F5C3185